MTKRRRNLRFFGLKRPPAKRSEHGPSEIQTHIRGAHLGRALFQDDFREGDSQRGQDRGVPRNLRFPQGVVGNLRQRVGGHDAQAGARKILRRHHGPRLAARKIFSDSGQAARRAPKAFAASPPQRRFGKKIRPAAQERGVVSARLRGEVALHRGAEKGRLAGPSAGGCGVRAGGGAARIPRLARRRLHVRARGHGALSRRRQHRARNPGKLRQHLPPARLGQDGFRRQGARSAHWRSGGLRQLRQPRRGAAVRKRRARPHALRLQKLQDPAPAPQSWRKRPAIRSRRAENHIPRLGRGGLRGRCDGSRRKRARPLLRGNRNSRKSGLRNAHNRKFFET